MPQPRFFRLSRSIRLLAAYGLALLVFGAALLGRFALGPVLPPAGFPFLTFFPAVLLAALLGGLGPGLLTAALSVAAADYFFMPELDSFTLTNRADAIALVSFAAILLADVAVIHAMTSALRRARAERERAAELSTQRGDLSGALDRRLVELRQREQELKAALEEVEHSRGRLAASEARLRTIVGTVPVGLVLAELPSGRILGGNAHVETMLRHPVLHSPDIHSYGEWVAFHADGRQVHSHEYPLARIALAGEEAPEIEVQYRRGDGSLAWTRIMGRPVRDAAGQVVGGVVALVDVEGERRSRTALAESEARYRRLAEALPIFVFIAGREGGNSYTNARFQHYAGLPAEALLGDGWLRLLHPEDHDRAAASWAQAVAQGEPFQAEFRLRRHDGAWRWFLARGEPEHDAEGRIQRWIGTCTDVDDTRRTEAALAASEARLRSVVETAADGILVADGEGRIVSANPAALRMFGYDAAAELIGRDLGMLMPDSEATRHGGFLAAHRRGPDGGAPARAIHRPGRELLATRRDGSTFPIELSVASFTSGGQLFFTGVLRDVAERKRAEELRELLAREVDHRAKNALTVALSLLRLTPRDDAAHFATAVEGRVAAMARAHSLLATEKWRGAELRAIAEGELAAHAAHVWLSGPPVRLTPEAVQPVAMLLHELATNAVKYGALSARQGQVLLSWSVREDGGLHLRWQEQGGPAVQPPGRRGFGSRLIASLAGQQLGGGVGFEWLAEGLACSIDIAPRFARVMEPAAAVPERPRERRAPSGPPAAGRQAPPRILVVEDDALISLELEEMLQELGCAVVGPARTLAEAVRLAATEPLLDAAVLDVNLGGGEFSFPAVDLLQTRGVPYIFATGYGSARSLQGRDHGAAAVLLKPYPRAAMADALGSALRQEGPRQEGPPPATSPGRADGNPPAMPPSRAQPMPDPH